MGTVVDLLRSALGEHIDLAPAALEAARADASGHHSAGPPLALVRAASVQDVQAVMRIATETRTPVVVQGARTGLAGAAMAGPGEIALSVRGMDRILEVSAEDQLAVVEPGILNAQLNRELAGHGLWWAPDPASREICTVGGNIATGAGGLLCAKYGVVRDAVLALDVVLADGRLLHTGHRSVKGVTGLDLTSLLIGSEGTLGVVVSATLKLRHLVPGATHTLTGEFTSAREAAEASAAVTAAGIQPAIMELLAPSAVEAISALLAVPVPTPGAAQLTVQTDGPAADEEARRIEVILREYTTDVRRAQDEAEAESLLHFRRSMHAALERLGTTLIEDVSVPRSRMADMFDEITRVERDFGITIPTVAHAADGNLHPNFVFDGPEVPARIWEAADELFRSALRLGGTLTGEHGVGVLKQRWLAEELGEAQVDLQRGIKRVFDPLGILGPGRVFA
jgi:glycolate oxidase